MAIMEIPMGPKEGGIGVRNRRKEGRAPLSWIFIHGTNIVDRGSKVLFFGLFSVGPLPPGKRLNSAVFRYFLLIFCLFFVVPPPPGKFSADALGRGCSATRSD